MPGNIQSAVPNGVMPFALCTAFTESREYAQLQNDYHDGTIQRAQLAQSSRRIFRPNMRLDATNLAALYTFLTTQNFGMTPFLFLQPVRCALRPADRQQLRRHGQQHAGARRGRGSCKLGANERPVPD